MRAMIPTMCNPGAWQNGFGFDALVEFNHVECGVLEGAWSKLRLRDHKEQISARRNGSSEAPRSAARAHRAGRAVRRGRARRTGLRLPRSNGTIAPFERSSLPLSRLL
eukprot:scaffold41182_cov39-Tisochrysis_lutea.AAC.3